MSLESFNSDKEDLPDNVRESGDISLQENIAIISRKKYIWRISLAFICLLPALILLVLGYICYYLAKLIYQISNLPISTSTTKYSITPLNQFTSLWHIFLITFVVLTTLLGIFVRINMSTWKEANKNKGKDIDDEFEMIPTFSIVKKATDVFK